MSEQTRKVSNSAQRASRTRANIHGTTERPRLTVHISNKHLSAQIINDDTGKTLVSSTTVGSKNASGNLTEKAASLGADIAKKAKANKITKVVFDRGSKQYHGRIKALADAARDNGLEF
jgi:large subunit ribosomal protein L18